MLFVGAGAWAGAGLDAEVSDPFCSEEDAFMAKEDSVKSKLLGLNVEFDGEVTSFELSDFFRSLSQLEMEFREGDIVCGEDAMADGRMLRDAGHRETQEAGERKEECSNLPETFAACECKRERVSVSSLRAGC